ncbi:hypothetical protein PtA15_16A302 [Puccinia triticina]|uniref:Uncharacterized protein n=1 Tax=Puccinia triticina TaxID=208348 RepID=A0ABY7D6J2_9BASI|nr:uncharacterized protein PtA15_16A302 [Puccinia triticina]WAQ92394.1 hypothetical protein PtA15_16A302 [Puccinia triticina]
MPAKNLDRPQNKRKRPGTSLDIDERLMTEQELADFIRTCAEDFNHPEPSYNLQERLKTMSAQEQDHHRLNLLNSLVRALKKTTDILKTAKNRRLISNKSSPKSMWWFLNTSKEIENEVYGRCPTASKPISAKFVGISVVQCLPRDEVEKLVNHMQEAGTKALKGAEKLLSHTGHMAEFLARANVMDVEFLRVKCWELLGSVENSCPGLKARKQVR